MADTCTAAEPAPLTIWQLTASAHRPMIAGAAVAFVGSMLKVVPYIALVEIGRGLLGGASAGQLWWWAVAAIVATLAHGFSYSWALGVNHIAEAELRNELRHQLVDKLGRVDLGWFTERSSGKIRKAIISDTSEIHTLVAHLAGDAANSAGVLVAGLGYLLYVDARLAGVLFGAWLVMVLITMVTSMGGMAKIFADFADAERDLSAVTVEMVDGIKEVKNFGISADVHGRFEAARHRHAELSARWLQRSGTGMAVLMAAMQPAGTLAVTVGVGYWLATIGWTTPVNVLAFALVWIGIPEGLLGLVQLSQHVYSSKQAALTTLEILQAAELVTRPDRAGADDQRGSASEIELCNVEFGYEPGKPVIKGANLVCRPGTVTALVGPSGGGKSTLAKLIARFWDVDQGSISIGGVDVRGQTSQELYGKLALVFQEVMITAGTVTENIALGNPKASAEEIVKAAKAAFVHDRIMALPNGYDTVLGEADGFLSGGELQRLTIARAFLAAPEILILDEATAQADAHSELQIQRAITGLAAGRTVVMIAHRLATIKTADQIAVIVDGRIVECGRHEQLLALDGEYARMWAAQTMAMTGGVDA